MVDPSADRAIFRQIADELRTRILAREYPPGGSLPSEAAMVHAYDAGRQTIRKALDVLESEGRIVRRRGMPATVAEDQELTRVKVMRGSTVGMDAPTPEETRQWRLEPGVKMFVVVGPGGKVERWPGDRYELGFA